MAPGDDDRVKRLPNRAHSSAWSGENSAWPESSSGQNFKPNFLTGGTAEHGPEKVERGRRWGRRKLSGSTHIERASAATFDLSNYTNQNI